MESVQQWLRELDLEAFCEVFAENQIEPGDLLDLTEDDLRELGLPMGPRKRLLKAISALAEAADGVAAASPSQVTAPPLPSRTGEGERRQLTVMFCDLADSTALSERFDPEDLGDIVRDYQNCCAGIASRYEGYIARYMGDGILLYFGYPQAHEDDAERALRAGLEIVQSVKKLRPRPGLRLQVRIGVATGPVVVGETIGEGESKEQVVLGETPNLAARLQGMAHPGSVLISATTRKLVAERFDYLHLGQQQFKGFVDPIDVWVVSGLADAERRRGRRDLTRLTGRDEELAQFRRRWQMALQGQGQIVMLTGEAGIGKSRLIRSLRDEVDEQRITVFSGYCSPYHINTALYSIIGLVGRAAGVQSAMAADEQMQRLSKLLQTSCGTDEELPLLAALMSVSGADSQLPDLSPQQLKDRTIELLARLFLQTSSAAPVLFVIEDLHWADHSTLEFLDRLVDMVDTHALLVVATFRPEFDSRWTDLPIATTIPLTRFAASVGEQTVFNVAGKPLPPTVVQQIVEKSDGVPLYIEELTRTLLESGQLIDKTDRFEARGPLLDLQVPSTLQDSLMARLDRLSTVKEIARLGSVIGRQFSFRVLAPIVDFDETELAAALRHLTEAQILYQRGTIPDAIFTFKHSLVQEAAYSSILRSRLKNVHADVARALLDQVPGVELNQPELLTHHYERADMFAEALGYAERAGERSLHQSANTEAINHFLHARELIAKSEPDTRHGEREISVLLRLGAAYINALGWAADETESTYLSAKALCETGERSLEHFSVYLALHRFHAIRGELAQADDVGAELLAHAELSGDADYQMPADIAYGYNCLFLGKLKLADQHLAKGLAAYKPEQHSFWISRWGEDPGIVGHGFRALVQALLGNMEQATTLCDAGLKIARDSSHQFSIGFALWIASRLHQLRGDAEQTLASASELLSLSQEKGLLAWISHAMVMQGWSQCLLERDADGLAQLNRGLELDIGAGSLLHRTHYLALRAQAQGVMGDCEAGLASIDEAFEVTEKTAEGYATAELYRIRGELLSQSGQPDQAAACVEQAMHCASRIDATLWHGLADDTRNRLIRPVE